MPIIKKITAYIAVDEDKLFSEKTIAQKVEEDMKDGYTKQESLENRSVDSLETGLEYALASEYYVKDFEYAIDDIYEEDKESIEYRELIKRLED